MVPRPETRRRERKVYEKPAFHVQPPQGWLNDPNGPVFFEGLYHMFYQWFPEGSSWSWGLYWGHAVSEDMVTWRHLPAALSPTEGGPDQDGCWSGCAVRDVDGTPTILYTAVRLRGKEEPANDLDLNLPMIESQCLAVAEPGDGDLKAWKKVPAPIIPLPPHVELGGFRDPFVLGRPGDKGEEEWTIMVGSGIKDIAGTALVYKSPSLHSGWRYVGELCRGMGKMWECPVMTQLPLWQPEGADEDYTPIRSSHGLSLEEGDTTPGSSAGLVQQLQQKHSHMLAVCPDDCNNAIVYYLGSYANGCFDIDNAVGPFPLDLGNILYAPQIMAHHPQDQAILFGWLQEKRPQGTYSYSGCLSVPRQMWLELDLSEVSNGAAPGAGIHLRQQPIAGMAELRSGEHRWSSTETLQVTTTKPFSIPEVGGLHWEVNAEMEASIGTISVLIISSAKSQHGFPLLTYNWSTGALEVFIMPPEATVTPDLAAIPATWTRVTGGTLRRKPAPGQSLELQIFLDYSVLEVFTRQGEALTTRLYPTDPTAHVEGTLQLVSLGGPTTVNQIHAYELETIWGDKAVDEGLWVEKLAEVAEPVPALV